MTIDIIGGGIGGLTTAIALSQKGISSRIFEQAEVIKPVGAGIILASNAMQIYEKLGLKESIEKHGHYISSMNITRPNLSSLSAVDLTFFERKHKVKNIAIHRGILQQILIDHLQNVDLKLDYRLSSIEMKTNGQTITFENGERFESSLLIGADGLMSKVRQHIFPDTSIRHAQQICWRGITNFDLPNHLKHELNEAWGKGHRFGFVQLADHKVYWYALKTSSDFESDRSSEHLTDYFEGYAPIVNEIIQATPKDQIITAEIADLKPTEHWYKDQICLIGDAAHATTPNMGQGACQAIEDAFVLAHCLQQYDTPKAFEHFQNVRLKKAHQVVKMSWQLGKISHWSNPLLARLRNQLIQLTPASVNRKQTERIFQIANL